MNLKRTATAGWEKNYSDHDASNASIMGKEKCYKTVTGQSE
jgi:hypothetical protein